MAVGDGSVGDGVEVVRLFLYPERKLLDFCHPSGVGKMMCRILFWILWLISIELFADAYP